MPNGMTCSGKPGTIRDRLRVVAGARVTDYAKINDLRELVAKRQVVVLCPDFERKWPIWAPARDKNTVTDAIATSAKGRKT